MDSGERGQPGMASCVASTSKPSDGKEGWGRRDCTHLLSGGPEWLFRAEAVKEPKNKSIRFAERDGRHNLTMNLCEQGTLKMYCSNSDFYLRPQLHRQWLERLLWSSTARLIWRRDPCEAARGGPSRRSLTPGDIQVSLGSVKCSQALRRKGSKAAIERDFSVQTFTKHAGWTYKWSLRMRRYVWSVIRNVLCRMATRACHHRNEALGAVWERCRTPL